MNARDNTFDPALAMATYRRIIALRNAAKSKAGREEYEDLATRFRQEWKRSQGEDSLHKMAFGEPA